jgi:hypothetical protein
MIQPQKIHKLSLSSTGMFPPEIIILLNVLIRIEHRRQLRLRALHQQKEGN